MANQLTPEQIQSATQELSKLPLLGPALWLFARDPQRRFTFIADIDWRLMPPLVLDQCQLYKKQDLPWGFCTWANVSDAVDARLRSQAPLIAPHEWRSGENAWLVDVVAPFGDADALIQESISKFAPGKTVRAWLPGPAGTPVLREFAPHG